MPTPITYSCSRPARAASRTPVLAARPSRAGGRVGTRDAASMELRRESTGRLMLNPQIHLTSPNPSPVSAFRVCAIAASLSVSPQACPTVAEATPLRMASCHLVERERAIASQRVGRATRRCTADVRGARRVLHLRGRRVSAHTHTGRAHATRHAAVGGAYADASASLAARGAAYDAS